jgi:hypothetical protein
MFIFISVHSIVYEYDNIITDIKCRPYISLPIYKPIKSAYTNEYQPRAYCIYSEVLELKNKF